MLRSPVRVFTQALCKAANLTYHTLSSVASNPVFRREIGLFFIEELRGWYRIDLQRPLFAGQKIGSMTPVRYQPLHRSFPFPGSSKTAAVHRASWRRSRR